MITVKEDVEDPLLVQALIPEYAGEDENENSIVSWFGLDGSYYLFLHRCCSGVSAEVDL